MKISMVIGTRPDIIKSYPIINEIQKRGHELVIIYTGQHYSDNMSGDFFKSLQVPEPKYKYDKEFDLFETYEFVKDCLQKEMPDFCFVAGDTDTGLVGAFASKDMGIVTVHRESGLRSRDRRMHEEKNRIMIDREADIKFVPTKLQKENLKKEGITDNVYITGNTISDIVSMFRGQVKKQKMCYDKYYLATFHRKENVDNFLVFSNFFNMLGKLEKPVMLIKHHYTMTRIKYDIRAYPPKNMMLVEPCTDYIKMLNLIYNAEMVITDSGGLQEECAILGKKCVVVRKTTDRPETVELGATVLQNPEETKWVDFKFKRKWKHPYGENVAEKMIDILENF